MPAYQDGLTWDLSLTALTGGRPSKLVTCREVHTWTLGGRMEKWFQISVQLYSGFRNLTNVAKTA